MGGWDYRQSEQMRRAPTGLQRLLRRALISGACCAISIGAPAIQAHAAWETEVLSAVEKQKTLPDLDLLVSWDRLQRRGKVTREWIQDLGSTKQALDVKELRFTEVTQRLLLGLRVGLFRDLEFHVIAPLVLQDDSEIGFAAGVRGVSTISGSPNADDPTYPLPGASCCARYPITDVPGSRQRSGFGDMIFGLAWSPVNDQKDEAFPTLTLRADITAPTGKARDPTDQAALPGGTGGSVGLGMTVFDLSIGLSRRMSPLTPTLDPYMIFGAEIPLATPGQKARGMEPPPSGRFRVGTEIIIDEDQLTYQRYAIDISFGMKYVGTGRTYSELSDYLPSFDQTQTPKTRDSQDNLDTITYADYDKAANYRYRLDGARCGKIMGVPCGSLNKVDEYLAFESSIAFHIRPARFALFRAGVGFGIHTDHFLTGEKVGTDLDDPVRDAGKLCDGSLCVGRVNARNASGKDERSPYYDPRYDTPGHRFRIEETTNFTLFVTGAATF